jgi:hypothetical protein
MKKPSLDGITILLMIFLFPFKVIAEVLKSKNISGRRRN